MGLLERVPSNKPLVYPPPKFPVSISTRSCFRITIPIQKEAARVDVLKALLRYYSYLFHALLALFLLALSGIAMLSGSPNLQLGMLPWTGASLISVLFYGSLAGLITVILAMRGKLRFLFLLWCLTVAVLLIKGYIFTGYRFSPGEFRPALYLVGGSILTLPGAFQLKGKVEFADEHLCGFLGASPLAGAR
jgi:hypothetical protein